MKSLTNELEIIFENESASVFNLIEELYDSYGVNLSDSIFMIYYTPDNKSDFVLGLKLMNENLYMMFKDHVITNIQLGEHDGIDIELDFEMDDVLSLLEDIIIPNLECCSAMIKIKKDIKKEARRRTMVSKIIDSFLKKDVF